jgi:hypothetical protein
LRKINVHDVLVFIGVAVIGLVTVGMAILIVALIVGSTIRPRI